jgi:peptidoglycan hydrolase-like protein with peptidoglycan-binding domain
MSIRVHVVDPANVYNLGLNPQRTGWHNLYGSAADALNGNISRVFLTNILQSIPSSGWQQDTNYTCGPSAMAIALGMADDNEAFSWLKARGLITSAYGTSYSGIVGYLNAKGYSCDYDGYAHDGEMSGSFYDRIVSTLKAGRKVILCMHHPRTNYWTNGGHYIVLDAIDDGSGSSTSSGSESSGSTTGGSTSNSNWQDKLPYPMNEAEAVGRAQINLNNYVGFGLEIDNKLGPATLEAMIAALQVACNKDYNAGLKVDGRWGPKTDAALGEHYVTYGESQELVRAVQICLLARGDDPQEIDAQFGDHMKIAVETFQRDTGLEVDGVAGPLTIRKLVFVPGI